jgi:hypothetical protein
MKMHFFIDGVVCFIASFLAAFLALFVWEKFSYKKYIKENHNRQYKIACNRINNCPYEKHSFGIDIPISFDKSKICDAFKKLGWNIRENVGSNYIECEASDELQEKISNNKNNDPNN